MAWTRTGHWLRTRTAHDPQPPSLQDPAGPNLVTFLPNPFLPQEGTDSARNSPLLYSRSRRSRTQEPGLRMWSVAKTSNSCSWRWLSGQCASCCHCRSQGLSGLPHAPCEQPTVMEASALAQRVAFIFSWCAVLTEGRDEKEGRRDRLPGSVGSRKLFC